jgi:hypothetical protein
MLMPPIIADAGFKELIAAYAKDTGIVITTKLDEMGKLMDDIKAAAPSPDVIFLPADQMDVLVATSTRTGPEGICIPPLMPRLA